MFSIAVARDQHAMKHILGDPTQDLWAIFKKKRNFYKLVLVVIKVKARFIVHLKAEININTCPRAVQTLD